MKFVCVIWEVELSIHYIWLHICTIDPTMIQKTTCLGIVRLAIYDDDTHLIDNNKTCISATTKASLLQNFLMGYFLLIKFSYQLEKFLSLKGSMPRCS